MSEHDVDATNDDIRNVAKKYFNVPCPSTPPRSLNEPLGQTYPVKHGAIKDGFAQNDPAGHAADALELAGQYEPCVHGVAALKPVALQNEPNGQAVGALMPVEAQNEPVGHGAQTPVLLY